MLKIKELENSSIDKQELLKLNLYQRREELGRELNTEEIRRTERETEWLFNSYITINFIAYEEEKIVGWLGGRVVYPTTMVHYENHPIIEANEEKKKQIAQELLQNSFEYAIKENIGNIRVFVDVPEEKKKRFLELEQYYLQAEMKQTHTVLCMENKLSADKLKGIVINSEYRIESPNSQTPESLKNCYEKIFAKSFDNFTNSLDDEERKYWNTVASRDFNDASIVIKKDNEIVALILAVDYGDFMELGPIGVVANHRGNKLGKVLMEECLSRLIKMEKIDSYLEVDQTNTPAINLYETFGFGEVSKKHGFLYRIGSD